MGTDASMLIGDFVIAVAIALAVMWMIIKIFEVLYDLWKWGQITEDRIIRRMAEKRVARMYGDIEARTESDNISKLLRMLIDHSNNGIIRLRRLPNKENGQGVLHCIFANLTAGRFLDRTPDILMKYDSNEIIKLVTSGMNETESERVFDEFRNAVHDKKGIDVEVQLRMNGPDQWMRMIGEPFGEDFGVTFVNITTRKTK